jgi:ATP-binding cassette subfamily F protein 3
MIHLDSLSLAYGDAVIFNDVSCNFNEHQHIGVVGRNGAGKSTLLKAIAGQAMLDNGSVTIDRNKTIAYMPQDLVFTSTLSVIDEAFSTFAELGQLLKEKDVLEPRLHDNPSVQEVEQYGHVTERLSHYDISACRARTERILRGLGFTDETMKRNVAQLSVGWRMRVLLAKLLLMDADFYLFDEPTNHLDIVSKEWFFEFLKSASFGFLLVTHDRYFLDHAVTKIFELERGNGRLYNGTFSTYVELKEQERLVKESTYNRQQKEIARKQATIDRFRASASKASFVQSMIKQLDKMELVELDPVLPKVNFKFPQPVRAGDVVLSFHKLAQSFEGKTVFSNISGEVRRGEKVAVIAPNGAGKTTLFNLIVGNYKSPEEAIVFGHNVTYAYFEQDQTRVLHPKNTVLQEVLNNAPNVNESTVRTMLGSFLFSGDDVNKTIQVLSGGERCRVALVKLLLQNANFLLLDEPTNHLDLYAKEVLLQALQAYEGTVMLVSHDHDFLQRIATRILELTPHALNSYKGSYESYLACKKEMQRDTAGEESTKQEAPKAKVVTSQKERYLQRKELTSIEGKIERLEAKTAELTTSLGAVEYGSKNYHEIVEQIKKNKTILADLSKQWEVLMAKLDA